MRYKQLLSEQQLDELRMSPSSLRAFAASPEAQGIQAGFEAELVFTGLGGDGDDEYDMEPDMDADERCRSIQQVMDFFENDEYGYGVYGRSAERLQEALDEKYMEWFDEQMYDNFRDEAEDLIKKIIEEDDFDWDDETRKQLDMMGLSDDEIEEAMEAGKNKGTFDTSAEQEAFALENPGYQRYLEAREQAEGLLDDLVQDSLSSQDKNYDAALDEFRDGFYIDDDSGFFSDVGLRWMSDVRDEFDLMWPVMTGTGSSEGGFSEENAERLADDLAEKLGVQTKVSGGYHSATRKPGLWIFEPDSSLDADESDNMPVEIVSPPMPLEECLRQMENFFAWAESNGAYANSSTGFHMGVSLPHRGGAVDYVKLALFLGDEHVLREFGRSGNHYCEAAMKKIRSRIKGNKEAVGNAMELMKHNLIELAQKALEINNHGFGKYTSINPQGGNDNTRPDKERGAKYIEFRSAGGTNYFEDIDKLKNTLLRYAKAMSVAGDPAAERREYYKKLYKLIAPASGDASLDLFARFASGEISSEELKKTWAEKALEKEAPGLTKKATWVLYDKVAGKTVPGQQYSNYSYNDALAQAKKAISPGSSDEGFMKQYDLIDTDSNTGRWSIVDRTTGDTLEVVDAPNKGAAADLVYDKYTKDGGAFFVRPYVEFDQPAKLSQRAQLAKNIKFAPPEQERLYQVINRKTGEVYDDGVTGTKSSLGKYLRNFEKEKGIPQGDAILKLAPNQPKTDDEKLADIRRELGLDSDENPVNNERGTWEFFYEPTGRILDRVTDISTTQARAVLADVQRRYGDLAAPSIQMRKAETANWRGDLENHVRQAQQTPDYSQPPEGFSTQRPSTGDYYEVRSGDRVYGYLPTSAGQQAGGMGPARTAREYVNNLTGRNDAQLVYRNNEAPQQNQNESRATRAWESILDEMVKPVSRWL